MTHRLLQVVLVLLLVLPSAILSGVTASVTRADPVDRPGGDTQNPVVVVLDTSGSMNEADASGTPRIVGARSAVLSLVDALPPRSQFALIAYPGGGE
ncbi:MAG TPA: VWA domain-containing protein, partial [Mycobacterium sp.]|nr:VWA domain-containing protein [Mycobacterium sp.]